MKSSRWIKYEKDRYYKRMRKAKKKLGGECVVCGSTEKLEFDHIDSSTKKYKVSEIVKKSSYKDFMNEVRKCQLLCKECHGEKTSLERRVVIDENGKIIKHGTRTAYSHYNCRCKKCTRAEVEYTRKYREERSKKCINCKKKIGMKSRRCRTCNVLSRHSLCL